MDKAQRVRDRRDPQEKRQLQRNMWLATGGVVLAIVAMVAVLNRLNQVPSAPGPAKPTAADLNAPKSLRVAAAKVGFHPQLIPGGGDRGQERIRRALTHQQHPAQARHGGARVLVEDT